jgi:hypothetical protein
MAIANRISVQCRHLWFIHLSFDDICSIARLDDWWIGNLWKERSECENLRYPAGLYRPNTIMK